MDKVDSQFRKKVYEYVRQIPNGRVMTYGQLAALAGYPYAARVVGGIAHWARWPRVTPAAYLVTSRC
jgi:alkylated DNA nucleotide flippase Atl1